LKQKGKDYAASKGYDFEEVSARTAEKVFDTIKNFGKKVADRKTSLNTPTIHTTSGKQTKPT
jgi:hypothetical protein